MSSDDARSPVAVLTGVRVRALLAFVVLVAIVASESLSTPLLAVTALLGVLALAVAVFPSVRDHWGFNVLVGVGVALYGFAYALDQTSLAGRAFAALIVVVGLLVALNHLGIAPWSDHPRRI